MFIVSANYRDRGADKHWLVRRKDEAHEKAREALSLVATDVRFTFSDDIEAGFGCGVVAYAKTKSVRTTINKIRKGEVKLHFDGIRFRQEDDRNKIVRHCTSLRLTPDGSVYAILAVKKPKKKLSKATSS